MQTRNLVGGGWCGNGGQTFDVRNPATDEVIGSVPDGDGELARAAIEAAAEAFPGWRARPAAQRAELLLTLARLIHRDADRLAQLMTVEQGKPLKEARGEVV